MCPEHQGQIRAICALPIIPNVLPKGGFATGSLDKTIRIYEYDTNNRSASLKGSLTGHMGGVISLSLTKNNELISGGWEGHVRIWDLSTGKCLQVLEGHENGTCVLGLPTGDIIVGSTGRKNEYDQHLDYKIRIWSKVAGNHGPASYVINKVIEDHTSAIRDLVLLPEVGFISVSNDGTTKVRTMDGKVISTFTNPLTGDGHPVFCFSVHVTKEGLIVTCNDDQTVRIYTADNLLDEIPLPGIPWRVSSLSNGDLVMATGQAASSRRGHVYFFSNNADRKCSELEAVRFKKDIEPPPKPKPGESSDDPMSGTAESMRITGPYDARNSFPGTTDQQYGFFKRSDGLVMLCSWSAAANCWADIGEVTDKPGEADNFSTGGSGGGATGSNYDFVRGVTLDTATGTRSMQLCWNLSDDPIMVAKNFINHNGLSDDSYEEVKNFLIETNMREGAAIQRKKDSNKPPPGKNLPTKSFIDNTTIDFKKVWPKVLEFNAAVPNDVMFNDNDITAVRSVVDILEQTGRYHSSTVPRNGVKILLDKGLRWPLNQVFPIIDIYRILMVHNDGAKAVEELGPNALLPLLNIIQQGKKSAESRPAVLLAARTLTNYFRHENGRKLINNRLSDVLDSVGDLIAYDHATVRYAASFILYNIVHHIYLSSLDNKTSTPSYAVENIQQIIALIIEGLPGIKEDDGIAKLLISLGTLLMLNNNIREITRNLDAETTIRACASSGTAKEIADEVVKVLHSK